MGSPTPGQTPERVPVTVYASSGSASRAVAREIADLIRSKSARGERTVLGLATGSTPQGVYDELVRLHREEGLSFRDVVSFNLDEYWPMGPDELQSYRRFMREHLFDLVDIDPANAHVPDGTIGRDDVEAYCERYEKSIAEAGGIDLQLLGIGRTGHIGFNEPGSPKDSRTRLITLDKVTRMDAASDFFGEWNVPHQAITMGVGSILDARRVVLIAFGEHKAPIVRRAVEGEITNTVAASFLQEHPNARFVLDEAAAAELTRFKTPWLLGPAKRFGQSWDDPRTAKKAVIWLAKLVNKPILKLTNEDYNEHGLQELVAARGGAYQVNIEVFKQLQKTITGWPGGKPGRPRFVPGRGLDDTAPPDVFPKRVLVFSPHPDDDVISMGGTFIRLCDQGHDVHVAYQTSGNIAVFDDEAAKFADFMREMSVTLNIASEQIAALTDRVQSFIAHKKPGEIDSPEIQTIKGLIRRAEARAGAKYSGVKPDRIHFLDMPFYETGKVKKKPLGEEDIRIVMDLLEQVRPHQVYAAGDLSDPHGTHRVCLSAITTALHRLKDRPWMKECTVWLYRGAWQEWGAEDIEMAVPLAPDEVERKRMAIFKHQSQKDRALFPGPNDPREFWQRAEDRNRDTARLYDALGLPEYQAIEGFVTWKPSAADGSLDAAAAEAEIKPLAQTEVFR
ncbi:MAG: glucosamine-6-phosphate deaminase [Planctomycetota bacterium]|nr:MAG: glucosamine-6-phosphate deaminase [Planctomycetota bacterium]